MIKAKMELLINTELSVKDSGMDVVFPNQVLVM